MRTPGEAGSVFWATVYILLIFGRRFAGRHRDELAGAQDPGAHADSPWPDARWSARTAAAVRRRTEAADQRRHHSRRTRTRLVFWMRAGVVVMTAFTDVPRRAVRTHARRYRHEYRHPVHAGRFVAGRAGHHHGGMVVELALSADGLAALERADGVVRNRDGPGDCLARS